MDSDIDSIERTRRQGWVWHWVWGWDPITFPVFLILTGIVAYNATIGEPGPTDGLWVAAVALWSWVKGLGAGAVLESRRTENVLTEASTPQSVGEEAVITEAQRSALVRLNEAAREYKPLLDLGALLAMLAAAGFAFVDLFVG